MIEAFLFLFFISIQNIALAEITKHGLIIVDVQYDFADPSGSLSVFLNDRNGYLNITSSQYVERINTFIGNEKDRFDFIVYSIDYHPPGHCSFASTMQSLGSTAGAFEIIHPDDTANTGQPWSDDICLSQTGYQQLWPDHCVFETDGARFMSDLYDIRPLPHLQSSDDLRRVIIWRDASADELYVSNYKLSGSQLIYNTSSFKTQIDHVMSAQSTSIDANVSQVMYVFKGRDFNIDSYSVFDGNDGETRTGLFDALNAYDYTPSNTDLTIFGIAYDYCVVFTCRDAVDHGYHVTIMDQLTAPVFPSAVASLKEEMVSIGMTVNYTYGNVEVDEEDVDETEATASTTTECESTSGYVVAVVLLVTVILVLLVLLFGCWRKQQSKPIVTTGGDEPSPNGGDQAAYDMGPVSTAQK